MSRRGTKTCVGPIPRNIGNVSLHPLSLLFCVYFLVQPAKSQIFWVFCHGYASQILAKHATGHRGLKQKKLQSCNCSGTWQRLQQLYHTEPSIKPFNSNFRISHMILKPAGHTYFTNIRWGSGEWCLTQMANEVVCWCFRAVGGETCAVMCSEMALNDLFFVFQIHFICLFFVFFRPIPIWCWIQLR